MLNTRWRPEDKGENAEESEEGNIKIFLRTLDDPVKSWRPSGQKVQTSNKKINKYEVYKAQHDK